LGIPGVIILSLIGLYYLNLLYYALLSLGIIVGAVLIVKGFALDTFVKTAWESSPIKLIATDAAQEEVLEQRTAVLSFITGKVEVQRATDIAWQSAVYLSDLTQNTVSLFISRVSVPACS
jgi:uncharacterized membrane protein